MASVANINDVVEGHVALEVECVDRLILNAYVPRLQVAGQVVRFLCGHLGHLIPSPALLGKLGDRFRAETRRFARDREIPMLQLGAPDRSRWVDRKLDHVRPHLDAAEREGRYGVVAIGVAQEFQRVWSAKNRSEKPGVASLEWFWQKRRVGAYYFYILDPDFGPAFIKICTCGPWFARVWVNGHAWAKRQATGFGGRPAHPFPGEGVGGGIVQPDERAEEREVLSGIGGGDAGCRHAQTASDRRGDVPERDPLVGDRVQPGAGGRGLQGQPVQARRVERVDRGPAVGAVAEIAGHPPPPGDR